MCASLPPIAKSLAPRGMPTTRLSKNNLRGMLFVVLFVDSRPDLTLRASVLSRPCRASRPLLELARPSAKFWRSAPASAIACATTFFSKSFYSFTSRCARGFLAVAITVPSISAWIQRQSSLIGMRCAINRRVRCRGLRVEFAVRSPLTLSKKIAQADLPDRMRRRTHLLLRVAFTTKGHDWARLPLDVLWPPLIERRSASTAF